MLWFTNSILLSLSTVVDHCIGSPCRNNGTCNNLLNEYNCTCPGGFKGRSCEGLFLIVFDMDQCEWVKVVSWYPFLILGGVSYNIVAFSYDQSCHDHVFTKQQSFICSLLRVMLYLSLLSEVDHCYESPCKNNGTCYNFEANYTCGCPPEFKGKNCEGLLVSMIFSD